MTQTQPIGAVWPRMELGGNSAQKCRWLTLGRAIGGVARDGTHAGEVTLAQVQVLPVLIFDSGGIDLAHC